MEPTLYRVDEPRAADALPFDKKTVYFADQHDFNVVQLGPGFYKDPHPYNAGDSFMLILSGQMDLIVDGKTYPLTAGSLAFIPKGAVRGFTAGPEGFTMFAGHLRG